MLPADFEAHPEVAAPLSPIQLGRESLTYSLGGLAYKGVALLSVPILARLLSPAELGLLDLAAVLASTVGLAVSVGIDQSVAYHEPRSSSASNLWSSALSMVLAGGALAVVLAILLQVPLALLVTGREADAGVVAAAAVYGAVMALSGLALVTIRLRASARTYAVASFLIVTGEMTSALAVAWLVKDPLPLMVLAWAAGAGIVAVPLLIRHLPRLTRADPATVRAIAAYGLPLVPAAIAWLIGDAWIRSTLARGVDLTVLGEYGIAYRIASILGLLVAGLGVAWYPYIYRSPPEAVGERAARMLAVVIGALGAAAVALTALGPEIIDIVAGTPYAGARTVVGPLAAGTVAMGAFVLLAGVIGSTGTTGRVALAAAVGALAQCLAATLLIPELGLAGAGVASFVGYATALVAAALATRQSLPAPGILPVMLTAVLVAAGLVVAQWTLDGSVAVRLGLAFVAIVAGTTYAARARPASDPQAHA